VAQAQADPHSLWVTLELRQDRVQQTFARAACAGVDNVCVMGGDAMVVIPRHVAPNTFLRVFVNHPEPPQQTGRDSSEGRHLLTPAFFSQVARILAPEGLFVVSTDNHWYAKFLQRQIGSSGLRALVSVQLEKEKVKRGGDKARDRDEAAPFGLLDVDHEVHLYSGRPGKECGVPAPDASSYFDRLFRAQSEEGRYFLVLRKDARANASSILMQVAAPSSSSSSFSSSSSSAPCPGKSVKKIKREGIVVQPMGKKTRFNDDD